MKYVPSIAFDEMSGSAKGVTAAKVRGRKYIRNRGYGGAVRTAAQAAVKSVFKQLSQSWRNLTNAQILAWNALAHTGRKVCTRNLIQDLRSQPLLTPELLDRCLRWPGHQQHSCPSGRRGASGSSHHAHPDQVHIRA